MHRYQILVEYSGTNFVGWQIQIKGKSIQKIIQIKLSKLLKQKISIIGSGRTDSGVHAIEQSAHFDCKKKIKDLDKFLKSINFFLNKSDISILSIKKKKLNFHARFSAKLRVYKYIIFNRFSRPSIEKNRGWHIIRKLDVNLIKKGSKKLLGTKDFSTFRASSCNAKSPIKTIKSIKIKVVKNRIEIQFKSQSFLQQQVRSMVGCLKYLGEKKWNLKKFETTVKSKNRAMCAPPAPAHGLYLEKVIY
ncbi:MAG: tRNA pseudouridine(38-40) synthase TruA [Candidatus Pelagibacter sp. TMED106]|jgi:tRNA pseudouridine38-40 synthase|nr:MAG: tRNA pseudouridine(38-40) synthase TruA [Candidatus Pelagibacter sp. TMED106]|tara:strand:- start:4867 stop:5607 length:741 start_codon:yes stop_codon:yes gene_type:complete